jgi:hypothetical protein
MIAVIGITEVLLARIVSGRTSESGEDARLDGVEQGRKGVVDRDLMTGEREDLRDAVAHQAGADDGDARFTHDQPAV